MGWYTRDGDLDTWKKAERKSLCSGFHAADPDAIIAWDWRMADLVAMDGIAKAIRNRIPAQQLPKREGNTKIQKQWLEKRMARADFSEKLRLYYYLGVILEDENRTPEMFLRDPVGGAGLHDPGTWPTTREYRGS